MFKEINLENLCTVELTTCTYGNGITLEGQIKDYDKNLGEIAEVVKKIYFRVSTGPYIYALYKNDGWIGQYSSLDGYRVYNPDYEDKPDNYLCFRLDQHERRLWQAEFPVYFGYLNGTARTEIELDQETTDLLKKDFD